MNRKYLSQQTRHFSREENKESDVSKKDVENVAGGSAEKKAGAADLPVELESAEKKASAVDGEDSGSDVEVDAKKIDAAVVVDGMCGPVEAHGLARALRRDPRKVLLAAVLVGGERDKQGMLWIKGEQFGDLAKCLGVGRKLVEAAALKARAPKLAENMEYCIVRRIYPVSNVMIVESLGAKKTGGENEMHKECINVHKVKKNKNTGCGIMHRVRIRNSNAWRRYMEVLVKHSKTTSEVVNEL